MVVIFSFELNVKCNATKQWRYIAYKIFKNIQRYQLKENIPLLNTENL